MIKDLMKDIRKLNANPGGGAVVIAVANFGVNLALMMDKKDFGDRQAEADVSYETMVHISDLLTDLYDDDIKYASRLVKQYSKNAKIDEKYFLDALRPQVRMNTLALKAMEILSFYLEYGKKSTLSDGEIANKLLSSAIDASMPTIELNLREIDYKYDIKKVLKDKNNLYFKNQKIIERRKG